MAEGVEKALWRSKGSSATGHEWLWSWLFPGLWVLGVCVAVWMALAPVPGWLELPAVVMLWIYGALHFLVYGLALLLLPFYLLWTAIWPAKEESEADKNEREQRRALTKWKMIQLGMAKESDFEGPEYKGGRGMPDWLITILCLTVGVALIAGGRPVLAFLYLFPDIALFLLNSFLRLRQTCWPR